MSNTDLVTFIQGINNLRQVLRSTADLYAGDITVLAVRFDGDDERIKKNAWSLFWAIPTLSGYTFDDEKVIESMARAHYYMTDFFGGHNNPMSPNVAQEKVLRKMR